VADDDRYYVILIDAGLGRQAVLDTLIHEWAHLLRGEHDPDDEGQHDDAFWTLFGEMNRAWYRTS